MRAMLIFVLVAFILLTAQGCKEAPPPKDETIECPFPLTMVDNICCLDSDSNNICDNAERPVKEDIEKVDIKTKNTETVVEIMDMKFLPPNITIKKGTSVKWVNLDLFYGNVTRHLIYPHNGDFYSGMLNYGESYSFTFTEPGVYRYIDGIYKTYMKTPYGYVYVTE